MLHYLIHTCSWEKLRETCRELPATIERELAEGSETGITPIEALVLLGTYTDHRVLMKVMHNFALRSLHRVYIYIYIYIHICIHTHTHTHE